MSKLEKVSWAIAAVLAAAFLLLIAVGFATGQIKVIEQLSSGGFENE